MTPDDLRDRIAAALHLRRHAGEWCADTCADDADDLLPVVFDAIADELDAAADRHEADHPGSGPCAEAEDDRARAARWRAER